MLGLGVLDMASNRIGLGVLDNILSVLDMTCHRPGCYRDCPGCAGHQVFNIMDLTCYWPGFQCTDCDGHNLLYA